VISKLRLNKPTSLVSFLECPNPSIASTFIMLYVVGLLVETDFVYWAYDIFLLVYCGGVLLSGCENQLAWVAFVGPPIEVKMPTIWML
jgi:hypothetical protein